MDDQQRLLEKPKTRTVLGRVKADSASLYVLRDTASLKSKMTDTLSRLSLEFEFDPEVFRSLVYHRVFRGTFKAQLRRQQEDSSGEQSKDNQRTEQRSSDEIPDCSMCGERLLDIARGEYTLEFCCGHLGGHAACFYEKCHRCPMCRTTSVNVSNLTQMGFAIRMDAQEWRLRYELEDRWLSANKRRGRHVEGPIESERPRKREWLKASQLEHLSADPHSALVRSHPAGFEDQPGSSIPSRTPSITSVESSKSNEHDADHQQLSPREDAHVGSPVMLSTLDSPDSDEGSNPGAL